MLKIFIGMVLGSLTTMLLLGGPTVADKVLKNAQTLVETQYTQPSPALTIYLLVFLAVILIGLVSSNTQQSKQTELAIKKLRRYRSKNI